MRRLLEIENNLNIWFKDNEYKGNDPYQVDEVASKLLVKLPFLKYARKLLKPFHVFIPSSAFSSFPKIYHPKAIGLIIGGNSLMYTINCNKDYLDQNIFLLELLKGLRNNDYNHYAWGSPFEWGSNPRYEANTPAVCLVVPIANALLDYYSVSKNNEALEISIDIARHIIEENGFREIDKDSICLNYSPVDYNEVYNSNALAAAFFFRLNSLSKNGLQIELAKKIIRFVINSQLANGAWTYSKESAIIDNRHTGYILESLINIMKYWNDTSVERAFRNGNEFYNDNLMDQGIPRWSVTKTYPLDIHDVAQSIITHTEIGELNKAKSIADFAVDNMSNGKDEFFFKYFKNGKVNRNVFIRWGQAWMYYALAKYLLKYNLEIV